MTDTDSILIGTEWIKVSAKHHGQKARIEKTTNRGPMFRFIGQPTLNRHGSGQSNQQFMRISWAEIGLHWKAADKDSEKRYHLWQEASHIEYLDKKIEESANQIMTTEERPQIVMEPSSPEIRSVSCLSVYHKPKGGLVPETAAYRTSHGNWICLDCKARREEYQRNHAAKMRETKKTKTILKQGLVEVEVPVNYVPPKLEILPGVEVLPQWKVTIIVRTEMIVKASDFLDLAAQLEGKGEIVKVEKI